MSKAEPIRVAQVVGKVDFGGVDMFVMNYYRHIDRNKVQFDFFMDGLNPTPIDDEVLALGGRVFKLPTYTDSMRKNLIAFRKLLKQHRYLIIHCHMNTLSVFWLREAKQAGVPVRISHSQSTAHYGEGLRTLMKYALRSFACLYPTHFFSCSEYAGRWLFGNRSYDAGKVTVIRIGRELNLFKYNPEIRNKVRNEMSLQDKYVIGHVGRFMHQKNHKFLVEVFTEVHKKNQNTILMLVGDGALRLKTEHMIDVLGLRNYVLFLGSRQDVHELYQAMDVFVLPSWYEGFPAVLIEAQIAGLPCVVSNSVTNEAALAENYRTVPLSIGTQAWAKLLLAYAKMSRTDKTSMFFDKGYDIKDAAEKLTEIYERMKVSIK